jgi:hypothetical protein
MALRIGLSLALALALCGCSTLAMPEARPRARALDPVRDDLSSLLIALDLPRGVQPVATTSVLTFDAGTTHLRLALDYADVDGAAGMLPPPSSQRAYYLLEPSDKDKTALVAAQAAARQAGVTPAISVAPQFCRDGEIDPRQVTVSALATLNGSATLTPLIDRQLLADLLAGASLPACV